MRFRDATQRGDAIWSAMMLNRTIAIVGAASGRGAREHGCEAGPEALRRSDLATRLWRGGLDPIWDATIAAEPIEDDIAAVRNLCAPLSQRARTHHRARRVSAGAGRRSFVRDRYLERRRSRPQAARYAGLDLDRRAHGCPHAHHDPERCAAWDAARLPAGPRRTLPGRADGRPPAGARTRVRGWRAQLRAG